MAAVAAQAGAAVGGKLLDVGMGVVDKLEARKGANSARSTGVRIFNQTSATLNLAHDQLGGGEWTADLAVPQSIAPQSRGVFMSESHGFMTGTSGYVRYSISGSSEELKVSWNNPFSGSNTNSATIENGSTFKVSTEGGGGNNATYSVRVTGEFSRFFCWI